MGNNQHQSYSVLQMPPGQWKQSGKTDHCHLIKNQETGQQAEVYRVGIMDDNMLQDELEMYEYRKSNVTRLVKVLNVQKAGSRGLCSGTDSYRVVTERIPLRLGQVDNLQLPEALHVLKECLDGFELIYPSIERPIEVTKDMIGFTPEGKVKVWVNTNFAVNLPDRESYIKSEAYHSNESEMPRRIFSIIEDQMQAGEFPQELKQRIANQQNNTLTFARMKTIIRNFSIDNNIPFLDRLDLFSIEQENEGEDQRVTIVQETRIQNRPPTEIQQVLRNNSIVKLGGVNGNKHLDEELEQIKDRSIPHSQFQQQGIVVSHQNPQVIPSQLAYHVNFPIGGPPQQQPISNDSLNFPSQLIRQNSNPPKFPSPPPQYFIPNNNNTNPPAINFQQAITYQQRPSNTGERILVNNNNNVFGNLQSSLAVAMQRAQQNPVGYNSQQLGQQNGYGVVPEQQFERVYLNNNVIPMNPEQMSGYKIVQQQQGGVGLVNGNGLQSNIPYHLSQNLIGGQQMPYRPAVQTPSMSSRNLSPLKYQLPSSNPNVNFSPTRPFPNYQNLTPINQFQLTPPSISYNPKNLFQFSTSAKKSQFSDTFPDINRPLFPQNNFQLQQQKQFSIPEASKSYGDDLLKRMEELTNNVRDTIDQAESDHKRSVNKEQLRDEKGGIRIKNYGKDRIRTFN